MWHPGNPVHTAKASESRRLAPEHSIPDRHEAPSLAAYLAPIESPIRSIMHFNGTQLTLTAIAIGGALYAALCFFGENCNNNNSNKMLGGGGKLGGKKDVDLKDENSLEIDEIGHFAVSEHNNRQNSLEKMNFKKVVSCQKQVVAGIMYHLVVEVEEKSQPKHYEAKVWAKPGGGPKKLEEFKPKEDGGLTSADMGAKKGESHSKVLGGSGPKKQNVPPSDPVVQEAAEHTLTMLNRGSNSLVPFELSEIVSAEAELEDESAKFYLLLKTKRGKKEEAYKSEVNRTGDGVWSVKHATAQNEE